MPRATRKKSSTGIYHVMRMTDEDLTAVIEETFKITATIIQSEPKESRDHYANTLEGSLIST